MNLKHLLRISAFWPKQPMIRSDLYSQGPERPSLQLLRILAAARQPAEGQAPPTRNVRRDVVNVEKTRNRPVMENSSGDW